MNLTLTISTLTLDAARHLVKVATSEAEARGQRIAVAVVDRQGALMAFERMDGVPAPIVEFAIDKAYTAAVTGAPTRDFFNHINSSDSLRLGLVSRSRLLVWGGGVPARADGAVRRRYRRLGRTQDEDIACATAALAAIGLA